VNKNHIIQVYVLPVLTLLIMLAGSACSVSIYSGASIINATSTKIDPVQFNMTGYPIVDQKVTYSMMALSDTLSNPNENAPLFQMLEELTNVHFEFEIVSTAHIETRKNLLWASGDCPDLMTNNVLTDSDIIRYGPSYFLALNSLIDHYMPNLKKVDSEIPLNLLDALKLTDGNIYSLPKVAPSSGPAYCGAYINQTWLDNLNLEMPETTEDFFEVLVAFRDNDCNGNGDASDEIPFAWCESDISYAIQHFGWFGTSYSDFIIKDGVVFYTKITDEYKEAVHYLHRLWEEQLMDPELFTQDNANFMAKGAVKPDIYGSFVYYRLGAVVGDAATDYAVMPPLNGGTGTFGAIRTHPDMMVDLKQGAIAKKVHNPEILVRWLDLLYDPEYGIQVFRGPKDIMLEQKTDGTLHYKVIPDQYKSTSDWLLNINLNQLPFYVSSEINESFTRTSAISRQLGEIARIYEPYFINDLMPIAFATDVESTTLEIMSDIQPYVRTKFAEWVVGISNIDTDWPEYVAKINSSGIHDCVAVIQSLYNRSNGN
jgi:putative aldouronate transport system substrate-binding protein